MNTDNHYSRVRNFERAVELVRSKNDDPAESCDDRLTDRTLFRYAQVVEEYSKTFTSNSEGSKNWALKAAYSYGEYVRWFLILSEDRKNNLICKLIQACSSEGFEEKKRKWILTRLGGGALYNMSNSFIIAGKYESLITEHEKFFNEYQSIEIFPHESVKQWYKWLRAQPDFLIDRGDQEVSKVMTDCNLCRDHWINFDSFLGSYIPIIPETLVDLKDYWKNESRKVKEWLSSSR